MCLVLAKMMLSLLQTRLYAISKLGRQYVEERAAIFHEKKTDVSRDQTTTRTRSLSGKQGFFEEPHGAKQ